MRNTRIRTDFLPIHAFILGYTVNKEATLEKKNRQIYRQKPISKLKTEDTNIPSYDQVDTIAKVVSGKCITNR